MAWESGEEINSKLRMRRLTGAIPVSYSVFDIGSTVYAECNIPGGTEFSGTDKSTVLQSVFGGLGSSGGSISLRRGTHTISSVMAPANGKFTLFGQGRENTILKLGANCHLLQLASIDDITIRDLSFDGTKATYNSDYWVGLLPQTVDSLHVENCDFYNFQGKGVFAREVTNSEFVNCRFYSNTQDGLYLENNGLGNPTLKTSVDNCYAFSNTRKGFNNGEIQDVSYSNCTAYSNTEDGFHLEGSAAGTYVLTNVSLTGCTAYSNTEQGFKILAECDNVDFIGCNAYDNTKGIDIRGDDTYPPNNIHIIGGSFYGNTDGIGIRYGVDGVTIQGVTCYNNTQGGVRLISDTGSMLNFSFADIHAYDDQGGGATQDYGVDFGAWDHSAKNFVVRNISGAGNTTALFRGTGIGQPIIPFDAWDDSDANASLSNYGDHPSIELVDNNDVDVRMTAYLPLDVHAITHAVVKVVSLCTGNTNLQWNMTTDWGAANESYQAGSDSIATTGTTLVADELEFIDISAAFTGAAGGDKIGILFQREDNAAGDNLGATLHVLGGYIKYV